MAHQSRNAAKIDPGVGGGVRWANLARLLDGSVYETISIVVIEDTGAVKLQLEQLGGGDLTFVFAGESYNLDTTPAAEVTLTAGTDADPQINYVYITESAGVLTLATSTVSFPATAHAPITTALVQTAASLAIDGAYKVHAWTDHLNSASENGHLSHINSKLRVLPACWISGVAPADVASGQLSTTAGVVFQLHRHTMPARDMSAGDPIWIANDPDASFTRLTDFDGGGIDKLSDGSALGNNKFFNLVVWAVVSESEVDCKLYANLPDAQYTTEADGQADTNSSSDFAIPADYVGTGFLVARYTLKYSTGGGGTITQSQKVDLRGLAPSSSPGGGSVTDHGELAGLADDDHALYALADGTRGAYELLHDSEVLGSSFPGTPSDGDIFYHTTHQEWFTFVSAQSAWFGEEHLTTFGRGAVSLSAVYLRGPDAPASAARGIQIPYDIAITRFTGNWTTSITTGGFIIRRDGSDIHTWNAPGGGATTFEETVAFAAFAGSAALSVFVQSTITPLNNPTCGVWWRREET